VDSKIEIRDHGICNHIKRDITLSLVGIDLFFVVVEGSANRFGTVQGNLVLPIFFYIFLVVFSMASIAI
jgi:hypothetical protein